MEINEDKIKYQQYLGVYAEYNSKCLYSLFDKGFTKVDLVHAMQLEQEWFFYLFQIAMLPLQVLADYTFIPTKPDEKDFVNKLIDYSTELVSILNTLYETPEKYKLLKKEKNWILPTAKYWLAVLNLIEELIRRDKFDTSKSPIELWYLAIQQSFYIKIVESGLVRFPPKQKTKNKATIDSRRILKRLYEIKNLDIEHQPLESQSDEAESEELYFNANAPISEREKILDVVVLLAQDLALTNVAFRESEVFEEFISCFSKYVNSLRKTPHSSYYLENGVYLPMGRNAKRTPNRVII